MTKVLVVGGAGYIGAHMVLALHENHHDVVTLDNLSTGHQDAVLAGQFIKGDLSDLKFLDALFEEQKFDAVMHFASFIQVGESVEKPEKYYQNNLVNTLNLLNTMVKHHVNLFIFSSTAAIFGNPDYVPIDLKHKKAPLNPYGRSKWMVEEILKDYDKAYGLKSICLRYFNAAGADPLARIGERHDPETHLIPIVLQAALGLRENIKIFGQDYPTKDGTCVRDYIHICDLCDAHLLALDKLLHGAKSTAYNLGNGQGFSVKEVIQTAQQVTGKKITVLTGPRREGDADTLIADASAAKKELGWTPKYPELQTIIEHAWQFILQSNCQTESK